MNRIIDPNDLRGGKTLHKVPIIPWEAYVACGLKVYVDGKVKVAVFTPQPMETVEEVFQVLRFIIAAQVPKPGPIHWLSVPDIVKRHFSFSDDNQKVGG